MDTDLESKEKKIYIKKQILLKEQITEIQAQIDKLIAKRKEIPYKIPLSRMPEANTLPRYFFNPPLQNRDNPICARSGVLKLLFSAFDISGSDTTLIFL
jgi:hypothetical protein